ncbi:type IV secretion system protein VirB1 [Rhizobium sp. PP-F2F-G48]|nr:type IV secretion system protein VirB1 [Rhizobium sp. PP-F2F-G48]
MVRAEVLAAVVSVESRFNPLAIRINSDASSPERPMSKAEAIEIATTMASNGQSVDLGLGGVSAYDLPGLGLSISDLFDPCLNLKATGILLNRYYRAAVASGATGKEAGVAMLQSYYGQGDAKIGAMVGYDRRIVEEERRLTGRLSSLTLQDSDGAGGLQTRGMPEVASRASPSFDAVTLAAQEATPSDEPIAPAQAWDVFGQSRQSTILIFSR